MKFESERCMDYFYGSSIGRSSLESIFTSSVCLFELQVCFNSLFEIWFTTWILQQIHTLKCTGNSTGMKKF